MKIRNLEKSIDVLLGKYNIVEKKVNIGHYNIDFVINGYIAISIITDKNRIINESEKEECLKVSYMIDEGYHYMEYDEKCDELEFVCEIIYELFGNKNKSSNISSLNDWWD